MGGFKIRLHPIRSIRKELMRQYQDSLCEPDFNLKKRIFTLV